MYEETTLDRIYRTLVRVLYLTQRLDLTGDQRYGRALAAARDRYLGMYLTAGATEFPQVRYVADRAYEEAMRRGYV